MKKQQAEATANAPQGAASGIDMGGGFGGGNDVMSGGEFGGPTDMGGSDMGTDMGTDMGAPAEAEAVPAPEAPAPEGGGEATF